MPQIDGDVIRIRDTEANILAGKPKIGQFAYATDTEVLYLRLDATTYQKINPVLEAPVDGKQYVRINGGWAEVTGFVDTAELNASTQWRNGWDCSEDPLYKYGLQFAWDNVAKKASITHTSGTVKLWTYDTYYEYSNGDPELSFSTALADENNDFFSYFDNTGQFVWIRTADVTNEALYSCIALKMTYCTTAANEILAIRELHDAFEPIGIRGRLHNTTGTVWSSGAALTGATVGSTTIGIAQGIAYDEDVKITMGAQINGSAILPKYFFDGLNASSLPRVKRGSLSPNIGLYDTEVGIGATGRVVYNNWTGTVWNLQILAASDYMCMHVFGANGADFVADVDYSIAVGQDNYNTISDARDGAASEALNLSTGTTAAREAVLLYTFIINADGEIQAVDGTGATFLDWRTAKSSVSSGASNDQDLASVLSVGNDAEGQDITNIGAADFNSVSSASVSASTISSQSSTTANLSAGVATMGTQDDLGATLSITAPTTGGYNFAASSASNADGLYVENGTGGDYSDPKYEYTDGGSTLHTLYSGNVLGVKYWFIGQTIETGTTAFTNCEFRQLSGGTLPNSDTYAGVNAPETGKTGTVTLITSAAEALHAVGDVVIEDNLIVGDTITPRAKVHIAGGTEGASDWLSIFNNSSVEVAKAFVDSSGNGALALANTLDQVQVFLSSSRLVASYLNTPLLVINGTSHNGVGVMEVNQSDNTNTGGLTIRSTTGGSLRFWVDSSNNRYITVGNTDAIKIDSSGSTTALVGNFRIAAPTVPASATDTGSAGEIAWDSDYVYVCVATNTWKKSGLNDVGVNQFALNFKFSREGFDGTFPGGTTQYSLPYTSFAEDGSTQIPGGGARATVDSKVTAITFQFDSMAGDATAYYRINKGTWTSLGTVTSATLYNTFSPTSLFISAGEEFEVAFSSTSSGSFKGPTATVYIRNQS